MYYSLLIIFNTIFSLCLRRDLSRTTLLEMKKVYHLHVRLGLGKKNIWLFWAKIILPMDAPLGESGLIFLDQAVGVIYAKINILGWARFKKKKF